MRGYLLASVAVVASLLSPSASWAAVRPAAEHFAVPAARTDDPRPNPVMVDGVRLDVVGAAGLPAGHVRAVAMNVTAVNAGADLFVTVWPSAAARPEASNVNLEAGQTRANLVVSPVGVDGAVNIATGGAYADIVVDVVGWFGVEGGYEPKGPTRVFDSRRQQRLAAGVPVEIHVGADPGEVVVLTVTGVNAHTAGFITAWPTGTPKPGTSNLNLAGGQTAANSVILPSGRDGSISVASSMAVDVLVDVAGLLPTGYASTGLARLLDTRASTRATPQVETIVVTGASEGQTVAVNVTAVDALEPGFVTVWPTGSKKPETSSLNAAAGGATPNLVLVPAGQGGRISLVASMRTHLLVDSFGSLSTTSGYRPVDAVRVLDTRAVVKPAHQVGHSFPLPKGTNVAYSPTHSTYPGTDIFAACGTPVLSVVDGVVSHVRRVDDYRAANPATWGGRSVAVVGDDGVRYYGSHYDTIGAEITVGRRVTAGTPLGTMGRTGDTTVCHLHFGLSLPCPGPEWSVRRGLVWPYPYLDRWRAGGNDSPQAELTGWSAKNPGACWSAMTGPFAADGG